MNKRVAVLFMVMCIVVNSIFTVGALDIQPKDFNTFKNSIKYKDFEITIVQEYPENVKPMVFNSWEEASAWVNNLGKKLVEEKTENLKLSRINESMLGDGYTSNADIGGVKTSKMPSGEGTRKYYFDYDVPGISAQTVESAHYFEYNNKIVTKCSSSANISGIGLATFTITQQALERYGDFSPYNYYSVLIGDLGYYIMVNGVKVGVYDSLELTYCLANQTYK